MFPSLSVGIPKGATILLTALAIGIWSGAGFSAHLRAMALKKLSRQLAYTKVSVMKISESTKKVGSQIEILQSATKRWSDTINSIASEEQRLKKYIHYDSDGLIITSKELHKASKELYKASEELYKKTLEIEKAIENPKTDIEARINRLTKAINDYQTYIDRLTKTINDYQISIEVRINKINKAVSSNNDDILNKVIKYLNNNKREVIRKVVLKCIHTEHREPRKYNINIPFTINNNGSINNVILNEEATIWSKEEKDCFVGYFKKLIRIPFEANFGGLIFSYDLNVKLN